MKDLFRIFKKKYNYHRVDEDFRISSANNEILFYKLSTGLLFLSLAISIINASQSKIILRKITEIQTDTLERVIILRGDNLTKIEFPRNQNIPTALNNPGCIRPGNPDVDKYAIGIVDTKTGPFLAFMNPEQGFKALKVLLKKYSNYTIESMVSKYAPQFENDTDKYINSVCTKLKCGKSTLVKNVNQNILAQAISEIEGYKR